MPACTDCGGTIIEYDTAAGNGFCVQCGTVVEENAIVNEITFGETSGGAAVVHGAYVAQGATHARLGGPFGNRGSSESREQTIANATRKIQNIATVLRLSEVVSLAATRLYTLAVEHKFTKGRKSMNVVAVCLYVACRQKETRNYMLIDFSDLLQVNVFELGHTYLQLVQTLNLRLPLVDPSHYISRFAALLEFGAETARVATDAVRLVQRFDRDWMTKGRRPAGICGAALLLAARMNNFRRSVEEVVQVVKIADSTVRKRVEEFRRTGSAGLTVVDFRSVWLEEENDPPAFIKGKEKDVEDAEGEEEGEEIEGQESGRRKKRKGKAVKGKGRKRRRVEDSEDEAEDEVPAPSQDAESQVPHIDPALLNQGILAGTVQTEPLFLPDPDAGAPPDASQSQAVAANTAEVNIDPSLLGPSTQQTLVATQTIPVSSSMPIPSQTPTLVDEASSAPDAAAEKDADISGPNPLEAALDTALAQEVSTFLSTEQASMLSAALSEADQRRQEEAEARRQAAMRHKLGEPHPPATVNGIADESGEAGPSFTNGEEDKDDGQEYGKGQEFADEEGQEESAELDLTGLDDEELDAFLLSEEEVKIKERIWVEMNREYLEAIAARGEQRDTGTKARKRRKTSAKPRDASNAHGSTAAESVRTLLKKNPKYSKRINYDALKDLFGEEGAAPEEESKDVDLDVGGLYRMPTEDKEDDVVVEEGGGAVGGLAPAEAALGDEDAEAESDKGEDWTMEDTYEQEY
ncbi:BRF1-domain-containing protein [Dentipellis sp. KUC8613]|nr:BRF1-domain-containing protein [Dentipellis sp. KUC8613]